MTNLPYVAVLNRKFCVNLEQSFFKGIPEHSEYEAMTPDIAAIQWMVNPTFQEGPGSMREADMTHQHKGYAKYVEIARIFGWQILEQFFQSVHADYADGANYDPLLGDKPDDRIFRMSKAAGVDLTPLLHFWGVKPFLPKELAKRLKNAKLKPSKGVKAALEHYMAIIPANSAAFQTHAVGVYGRRPRNVPGQEGEYYRLLQSYDESTAKAS